MKKFPFRWTPLTIGLAIAIGLVLVLYCCGFRITYDPALESSWSAISAFGQWVGVVVTAALTWIIHRKTQENDRQSEELKEKLAQQSEDLQRDLAEQSKKLQRQIAEQENRNVEIQRKIDLFNRRYEVYNEFKNAYYDAETLLNLYDSKTRLPSSRPATFSNTIENYLFNSPSNEDTYPFFLELVSTEGELRAAEDDSEDMRLLKQRTFLVINKDAAEIRSLRKQRETVELAEYFYPEEISKSVLPFIRSYYSFVSSIWDLEKRQQLDAFQSLDADFLKTRMAQLKQEGILEKMKAEILIAKNLNQKEPGD